MLRIVSGTGGDGDKHLWEGMGVGINLCKRAAV